MGESDDTVLSRIISGSLPSWLRRRAFTIPPRTAHAYDEAEWRDALVIVERGSVDIEGRSGRRLRLEAGALLSLTHLSIKALHNVGEEPLVLIVISRRTA